MCTLKTSLLYSEYLGERLVLVEQINALQNHKALIKLIFK